VGTLDHAPNLEGLVDALDAFAQVNQHAQIRIAGGPARIGAWLSGRYSFVDYLGPISNAALEEEAATWNAFLHPIFCNPRGSSTKLATAIGWKIPIVTTAAGRRGYKWREGNLVEAETPAQFALEATRLLDPSAAKIARDAVAQVADTSPKLCEVASELRRHLGLEFQTY